jgi:carboxyl-terminal processing protease
MSMRSRTLIALVAGAIFGFSAALAGGVLAADPGAQGDSNDPATLPWQEARLFAEVYERIKHNYVDQVSDRKLMDAAIRGMVSSLDPHSAYLNNEEFEETRLSTMGSYPGVGIEVAADGSAVKVVDAIQGSPAAQAGLRAGDEIVAIDGKEVGADVNGAIEHLRGVSGSTVTLTIQRAGRGGPLKFALRRANVEVHSVSYQSLAPGIGYVRIDEFSDTTPDEVTAAISALQRDNHAGLTGACARPARQSRWGAGVWRGCRRRLPQQRCHPHRRGSDARCPVRDGRYARRSDERRAHRRPRE